MKKTIFEGAATAIITPLTKDGIDYEKFGELIEWQIEAGIDAIVVMSAIIMNLQTFVSRNNSPLNPLVVSVGKVEAGSRCTDGGSNVQAGRS